MTSVSETNERLYTGQFFLLIVAHFFYMVGQGMQTHFGQYVEWIGGDVGTVGWIVGVGMVGSLVTRPSIGRWVDKIGCKPVILAAVGAAAIAAFGFQWVGTPVLACGLRLLGHLSVAAFLVTIAVMSSQIAPKGRSAECLASVGIGGLAGMAFGPAVGDFIFTGHETESWAYHLFFNIAAGMMVISFVLLCFAPSKPPTAHQLEAAEDNRSFLRLAWQYWPGSVAAVAFCFACMQAIPVWFLERFVEHRGFSNIKLFFFAYAPAAVVLRIVFRRAPERVGRRRLLLVGLTCYASGTLALISVHREIHLILPAILMGAGHCFSYPLLVDLAADSMPPQHRGAATALILAVVDAGGLFGSILCGAVTDHYGFDAVLITLAVLSFAGIIYYAWMQRKTIFKSRTVAL